MAARTNPGLRAELLGKLGVSQQRLSQLAQARKRELPMSTPLAVYTIAHEQGVDISKYLGGDETAEVRSLVASLRNGGAGRGREQGHADRRRREAARRDVKFTIAGVDVGTIPGLKPSHAAEATRMAQEVYPLLYIFENSLRDLIEAVLRRKHGKDWWEDAVPAQVQKRAEHHKNAEEEDPWHGRRGARPIDYVLLTDLWAILNHNWPDFKPLFPKRALIESIITDDMNVSRRPLAHMNPLSADDVANIKAAFRKWTRQLRAVEDKLP